MKLYFEFDDNQKNHLQNLLENQTFHFFENDLTHYFELRAGENEKFIHGIYFKFRQSLLNETNIIPIEIGVPETIMRDVV